jgi:hypothetical protein
MRPKNKKMVGLVCLVLALYLLLWILTVLVAPITLERALRKELSKNSPIAWDKAKFEEHCPLPFVLDVYIVNRSTCYKTRAYWILGIQWHSEVRCIGSE